MTESLVIVESPTKERTIAKFLGKGFHVKSSYGHIRDLPPRALGVDLDNNFEPRYVVLPKAKKLIPELTRYAKSAKNIFLATDYDREGEAIAWHLCQLLKLPPDKIKRITFHEITPEAIREALDHPRSIDERLVHAQQARRVLDRLVGYQLSPLLWKKVRRGLSAGRVQSAVVRLICDREEEISRFVPQEYWTLTARLAKISGEEFMADIFAKILKRGGTSVSGSPLPKDWKLEKFDRLDLKNKEQVDSILAVARKKPFKVAAVERKDRRRTPSAPYNTASLQQDASRALGYRAQRTMVIAQQLYEGISLGAGGPVGLITYMRTDSVTVAAPAREEAARYVKEKFGPTYLPPKPRVFKTKTKKAQEAHECVRPSSVYREPDKIKEHLTPEQNKLYRLIWERFMASQMADAVYDTVAADIESGDYLFRANGRTLRFKGFLAVQSWMETEDSTPQLPPLEVDESVNFREFLPAQHYTEPPPRYNEASLVKTLEELGIGRPSTYAPILHTIQQRGYVRVEERRIIPTDLGTLVNGQLKIHFSEIVDIGFTAKVEERLDEVASGEVQWETVIRDFYVPFAAKLKTAQTAMAENRPEPKVTDEKCQLCNSVMILRESRFGKFLSCSTYPACKFKVQLDHAGQKLVPQGTTEICEKCSKPMVVRFGRRGSFIACSGYPACRNTKPLPGADGKVRPAAEPTDETCDKCGKQMMKRMGRFGYFIACSGYPQCRNIKKAA